MLLGIGTPKFIEPARAIGWLLFLIFATPCIGQQAAEDRTISAMCRIGLGANAILYAEAQRKFAAEPSYQAKWTMRLMEAHALTALNDASSADKHWQSAATLAVEFADAQPEHPRLPWLAWQSARCKVLQAQVMLANYLAVPSDAKLREAALATVRGVMTETEAVLDDIRRRQPIAARLGKQDNTQAPAEDLAKLSLDTVLLQCEALLVRAQLYPPNSPDRTSAASEVETRVLEVISRSAESWPSLEQLTIAQAIARFEFGDPDASLQVLERLARDSHNSQTRIRAAMVAIERLAAVGATSRAQPLLAFLKAAGAGPELALAKIQVNLADIKTKPPEAKQQAMSRLLADAKAVGRDYGDYWRYRAEALLLGSLPDQSTGNSEIASELLLAEVRQLLAQDDVPAAVSKLLAFRDAEAAGGRGDAAIQAATQAAALLNRQQQWDAAIAALEPVVSQFAQSEAAATAHMLTIWSRTQALKGNINAKGAKTAYEEALVRQLVNWPDAPASQEAQGWLTQWLVGQGKPARLIEVLRKRIEVSQDATVTRDCLALWLEHCLQLPSAEQRGEQIAALHSVAIKASSGDQVSSSIAALRRITTLVARIFSDWPMPQPAAELRAQLQSELLRVDSTVERQLILAGLLLDALRASQTSALPALSQQWRPADLPPGLRIAMTAAWVEAIDANPSETHANCVSALNVDNAWIEGLQASAQPVQRGLGWRLVAWTQDASWGLTGLAELAKTHPRDGALQLQLSQALVAPGLNRLPESTQIAKQLAANSPAGSELNLAARWRWIRNVRFAGNSDEAKQSAALLLATLPDTPTVWRVRLQALAE